MRKLQALSCCAGVISGLILSTSVSLAQGRAVAPVLAFPEAGLDDPAAYQGYQTRFFRDAKGNVVQIYLDARSGRVVTLLADAVDESVGFTVRNTSGSPVRVDWGSATALISQSGPRRTIEYQLIATQDTRELAIGLILLGSMRVERDLGYSGRQTQPYGPTLFLRRDEETLVGNLERLDPAERTRELRMLNTQQVIDLRKRLVADISSVPRGIGARVTQASLDGKTHLKLDFGVNRSAATVQVADQTVSIRGIGNQPIRFTVRVTTDARTLTPLPRDQIFNPAFLRFLADAHAAAIRSGASAATVSRYRQMERDVRGTELLSSKEKLMAGLPNYATYFGRDMMMSSLMMEPVWQDVMSEHVIASALRKLGPKGDVSHEEALGGQAIRENASEYNAHIANYFSLTQSGNRSAADSALANARALLVDLQKVRENYHMRDDEFQLPVLAARYLTNPRVSAAQKRAFLQGKSDNGSTRLALLLKELSLVSDLAAPYARDPVVQNLIGSPRLDSTQWRSISWRDSNAGYANGRFAMDINAIWVPRALSSIADILASLKTLGLVSGSVNSVSTHAANSQLAEFARNPEVMRRAVETWDGAVRHFVVSLTADQVREKVDAKLVSLPAEERSYWQGVLSATGANRDPLEFIAISLDADGRPIPVVNTDPATWLFLHERSDPQTPGSRARAMRDVRAIMRAYPVGLFVDGLGPLVANDAYASPQVWEAFQKDTYHSPRVVWGREVNLFKLGLAKQISSAVDGAGRPRDALLTPYVTELQNALNQTNTAVDASGLKHNELWSYEIQPPNRLKPIRYGASTDVQLWNVTDLAVQFVLSRLPLPTPSLRPLAVCSGSACTDDKNGKRETARREDR